MLADGHWDGHLLPALPCPILLSQELKGMGFLQLHLGQSQFEVKFVVLLASVHIAAAELAQIIMGKLIIAEIQFAQGQNSFSCDQ